MLALGGGVVGDLVGYVAATYMRGVPYIQVPTSSTAMLDSSVGGKTAINVPAGKNLIGAFHQPHAVYADLDCLLTLGRRELVEGIAEAIKMGALHRSPTLSPYEPTTHVRAHRTHTFYVLLPPTTPSTTLYVQQAASGFPRSSRRSRPIRIASWPWSDRSSRSPSTMPFAARPRSWPPTSARRYATQASKPRLADPRQGLLLKVTQGYSRSATHTCEPCLGQGLRGTLNWGHTVGHAIEALKSPALMHGECVAIGCVVEAELSLRMGNSSLSREKIERLTRCFASYGLPVHVPRDLEISMLMKKMALDKKNLGDSIRCTIVTDIGVSVTNPQPVDKKLMEAVMSESIAAGRALDEWKPHEGKVAVAAAGGQMAPPYSGIDAF